MSEEITVSVIKADIGGAPGHSQAPTELLEVCNDFLDSNGDLLEDYYITSVGDDVQLILTHREGEDSSQIHELAWDTFQEATKRAKEMNLNGAGQDLLEDAFSGNIKGLGPGIAEMEFTPRESEPLVVFMMDKTEPGAFNLPIYKIFADPFNTSGLVLDGSVSKGFIFEIWDIKNDKRAFLKTPKEIYDILALIGAKSRYVIKRVFPSEENKNPWDEPAAAISTEKLYKVAGEYVGKDDPVGVVRCQSGLPALGEVLEPFSHPYLVSGWMRGSHNGPIMPVAVRDAKCTRFDGPPRVSALGFQLSNGRLGEPVDLFDDPAFDRAREKAQEQADYMRRHGPFEPHRLPEEEMEYTTLPQVLKRLKGKFKDIER